MWVLFNKKSKIQTPLETRGFYQNKYSYIIEVKKDFVVTFGKKFHQKEHTP